MDPAAELKLLGPPEVWVGGRLYRLPTRRLLALLAYLAAEGPTPREKLAGLLWEADEERARANLRVELHRLAQTPLRGVVGGKEILALEGVRTDLEAFQTHAGRGEWAEAQALFRGGFLEGFSLSEAPLFEEWLLLARAAWEERLLETLFRLAGSLEAQGEVRLALERYEEVLRKDPLQEEALRRSMCLHAALGAPAAALKLYHRHAAFLQEELGLPPDPATQALAEEVRLRLQKLEAGRLVGRAREWRFLEEAYAQGKMVFLVGEPGIGKTRLLLEFIAARGLRPALALGRPGDRGVPFATLARLLRRLPARGLEVWARKELARLLPELGEPPARAASPEEGRLRLFRALAAWAEAADRSDLAWGADDLQYADEASLEALAFLAAQAPRTPFLAAYRKGELSPGGEARVEELLLSGRAVRLELGPLDPEGVLALLQGLDLPPGVRDLPALAEALHRHTGGNPLFVLEAVRGLREAGLGFSGAWRSLPPSGRVQTLLRHRLERLSPEARRLAWVAAVAGEGFSEGLAAEVLGQGPLALAQAAAELERAGVLKGGRFPHDLLLEATLESLPPEVAPLLHRGVARALEARGAPPSAVAHHLEAGQAPLEAVPHRLRAAREASRLYRHREALAEYRKALEDAEADPPSRLRLTLETAEERYRAWLALADWEGMAEDLRLTERANEAVGDPIMARQIALGWADRAFRMGAYEEAIARCQALLEAGGLTRDQEAFAHYTQAVARLNLGQLPAAEEGCRKALWVQPSREWSMHGWVANTLALCLLHRGALAEAREHNAHALDHFRAREDGLGLANALRVSGLIAEAEGDLEGARALLEEALAQARRVGHRVVLGFALLSLLGFALRRGEREGALALCREGLALAQAARDPQETAFWQEVLARVEAGETDLGLPPL